MWRLETTKLQTFIYFQARTDRNSLLSQIVWNLLNDHKLVYKNNCLVVLWWWLSAGLSGYICAILETHWCQYWSFSSLLNTVTNIQLLTSNYVVISSYQGGKVPSRPALHCNLSVCRITPNRWSDVWHQAREDWRQHWQYLMTINHQQRSNREVECGGKPRGKIAAIN